MTNDIYGIEKLGEGLFKILENGNKISGNSNNLKLVDSFDKIIFNCACYNMTIVR